MPDAPLSWDEAVAQVTGPGGRYPLVDADLDGRTYKVFANTPPSLRALFDIGQRLRRRDLPGLRGRAADLRRGHGPGRRHRRPARRPLRRAAKGDRVAIGMRNYPEWIIAFAAITSIGAVAVSLNAWWTDRRAATTASRTRDRGAASPTRSGPSGPTAPVDTLGLRAVIVVRLDRPLPPGADRLEDVLVPGAADARRRHRPRRRRHDPLHLGHDRASQGRGVDPPGRAQRAAGLRLPGRGQRRHGAADRPSRTRTRPSFILVVPLFHVTGCVAGHAQLRAPAGAKLVMMYKWDPERALELIERERITNFVGVPTMSWDLLESPDFAKRDTSSLRGRRRRRRAGAARAGAPGRRAASATGRPQIGYGMTETNAYGPGNTGDDYVRKPTSTGRVVPVMEVQDRRRRRRAAARRRGRARSASAGPNADPRLLEQARGHRRDDRRRLAAHAATSAASTTRASSTSRTGPRTWSSGPARTSTAPRSRRPIYEHPAVYEAAVFGIPHERLGEELVAGRGARPPRASTWTPCRPT